MKTKTPNVSGRSAWLRDNITKYFSFSAIIILLVALSLTQDNFLGTSNLKNLLRDTAPLMIMSAGMTMVLLFGSIDLSMGAVCSVSNVTYIHLMLAFQDSFSQSFPHQPGGHGGLSGVWPGLRSGAGHHPRQAQIIIVI